MREIIETYGEVIISAITGVLFVGLGYRICDDLNPMFELFLSSIM